MSKLYRDRITSQKPSPELYADPPSGGPRWVEDPQLTEALGLHDVTVYRQHDPVWGVTKFKARLEVEAKFEVMDQFATEEATASLAEITRDTLLDYLVRYAEEHGSRALESLLAAARAETVEETLRGYHQKGMEARYG